MCASVSVSLGSSVKHKCTNMLVFACFDCLAPLAAFALVPEREREYQNGDCRRHTSENSDSLTKETMLDSNCCTGELSSDNVPQPVGHGGEVHFSWGGDWWQYHLTIINIICHHDEYGYY